MAPTSQSELLPDQLARCCTALKQQLGKSPYWSIRHLVCQIDRDRIAVQGTVSSFYLKQIVHSLAARAIGAERVRSEIDVQPE
jgi:BON domain-containing protein